MIVSGSTGIFENMIVSDSTGIFEKSVQIKWRMLNSIIDLHVWVHILNDSDL